MRTPVRSVLLACLVAACSDGRTSPAADGGDRGDPPDGSPGDRVDGAPPPARMFAHTADVLYTVDSPAFDLVEVGPFGLPEGAAMNDLAVTPSGQLYGITADELYVVDAATGAATFVAAVDGTNNVAMTFLGDGSLLAADKPGRVRRVHPESGAVEELGEYGDGYGTAGDLVAVADGTMYAVADEGPGDHYENNVLLTIDPATGEYLQVVGEIGYGHVFGVAYAGGKVYAFTKAGQVIEIDPATAIGTLVRDHAGVEFYGAGVTPLVDVD